MTNRKTTRRALFMSVISLMLCCAMLVGTTFAWFTDEVTSVNNIIKAGNLDVGLEYKNGNGSYTEVGSASLFTSDLWEPGHVEMVNLKVSNLGTLALKYQFNVNVISETEGTNVDDETFKLSDYIKFAILTEEFTGTREEAVKAAEAEAVDLDGVNWTESGTLYPKADAAAKQEKESYVTLVVWMPETVGNEANYKTGTEAPQITLGINLYATQVENENDSFGNDYDGDAWHDAMAVTSEAEMIDALANGGKISVENDIDLTKPLAVSEDTAINLNGNTLSAAGEIMEIADGAEVSIVNGIIESDAADQNAITVSNSDANTTTTLDLTDVTINFADVDSGEANEDVNYNAIVVEAEAGKAVLNVNDGTELNVVADHQTPIFAGKNSEVNVNGGEINVENDLTNAYCVWGIYVTDSSAVINVTGGVFNVTGVHSASGIYAYGVNPTVNISGGTFNVETSGGYGIAVEVYRGTVNATGGVFNIKATGGAGAYAFEQTSSLALTVTDGVTINVFSNWSKNTAYGSDGNNNPAGCNAVINAMTVLTDGLYQNGNTYYVESANGLKYFSAKALTGNNNTAETVVIELQADIDLAGADFSSIIAQRGDTLTFNGNGHTISNVNVISGADDNSTGQAGMFYCYPNSTLNVSNLILKDIVVTAEESDSGYGAAVVGFCEGAAVLNNVDVVSATVKGAKSSGMLAGHVGNGGTLTATNCDVSGSVTLSDYEADGHYAGKYVGTIADPVVLNNCTANVTVGGKLHANNVGNVYGRMTSAGSLTIDGTAQKAASTQDALNAAVSTTGNVDITLAAGEYKMPSSTTTGEVSISGTKETVLDVTKGAYMDNANVTITGVTIKTSTGYVMDENGNKGSDYAALYSPNTTYVNCTFVGPMRVGRDGAKFIGCTFTQLGNDYVWTYGNDVTFEGCTFNTDGKAILIYSDGGSEVSQVSVKNCVFNSTQGAKAGAIANQNCAAIEIHNYGNGVNLTTSGNTYDSNFSGEWRIKTYETGKPKIIVNGTEYTTIALDGKTMTKDGSNNVTVNP